MQQPWAGLWVPEVVSLEVGIIGQGGQWISSQASTQDMIDAKQR
jgi:hypothetical protein